MAEASNAADGNLLKDAIGINLKPGRYLIFADPTRVDFSRLEEEVKGHEGFYAVVIPAIPPVGGKLSDFILARPSAETIRREVIEECAKVADSIEDSMAEEIAARIRAL